jgi:crotonobetainyl-CoA:carnitine CoA-transferase CaiB-like acyl-CoA transferase
MVVEVEHTRLGSVRSLGAPVKLSEHGGDAPADRARVGRGAPLLGEHTREVLREAGVDEREIERLVASRVVAEATR